MQKTKTIYTVSQVNTLVKVALEEKLPSRLIVSGEISGWKRHTSGHCYFSLKDEDGVLGCVMWSSKFRKVKFAPEDGMAVLATGHIDVYTVGGKYQLYVDKLEPEGAGALQLAFEQMVKRLRAEGLFEEKHKKPLPAYPMRIGILTSESGAAVHDIAESIFNRWPCARLFLYPVPVQGEGAAEEIASAIRDINQRNSKLALDILIVGRGGGSMEDLWAFNEEVLARAIFDSNIPVISAVGHEVDVTVADIVADARASTPTKAGVVAAPDVREVLRQLANFERMLASRLEARLELCGEYLERILASWVFRNPISIVLDAGQQLDEMSAALLEALLDILRDAGERLSEYSQQIIRLEPHRLLANKSVELNDWRNRADRGINAIVNRRRLGLTAMENRLAGMNPKSVLQRGYSITSNKRTGSVIRKPADVEVGDLLATELAGENLIESKVTKK